MGFPVGFVPFEFLFHFLYYQFSVNSGCTNVLGDNMEFANSWTKQDMLYSGIDWGAENSAWGGE